MKNSLRSMLILFVAAMANSACTEKINLKLNDSSPRLTIECSVNDGPGPYYVILTKSRLYTENNSFTGLPSAQIIISDDAGNSDTLTEAIAGLYKTNTLQGTIGRTYKLSVTTEGTTYQSICKMPPPVDIDSIELADETNFKGEVKKNANIYVRDPAGVQNDYRVTSVLNDSLSTGFHIHSDRLWDGKLRTFNVPQGDLHSGDKLKVNLLSIDAHIYTYFSQFNQNQNNFGAPAAPANPDPVYTPSALGYFSAHSIKSKTIIVP